MRKLFTERNLRTYLVGQTISLIGDRILWLAMGIWTKTLTGSNGAAGLSFFFLVVSSLLSPLFGALVDRLPRRRLMLWTNLISAVVVASLVLVRGRGDVWLIYLVMFLYGLSYNVLGPGSSALLRMLVGHDQLGEANGYLSIVTEGCRLFAPLLGAGLFTVIGGGALGVIDAASFLVAAGSLVLVHVEELSEEPEHPHWRTYTAAGIAYLWRNVPLRQVTMATAVTLLAAGLLESIVYAVVGQGLHERPNFLGVLMTLQGVGAMCGALTAARVLRGMGAGMLVSAGLVLCGVACLGLIEHDMALVLAGMAVLGFGLPWVIVGFSTQVQRLTPLNLQGRVEASADFLVGTPQTISVAAGAGLIGVVDYRLLLIIIAAMIVASGLYLATRPEQRRERLEAATISIDAVPVPILVAEPHPVGTEP